MMLVSTARLCHITSAGSGTSPSSLRLNRFSTYPYRPVISALGIRGVLDMCCSSCRCDRHEDTTVAPRVTPTGIRRVRGPWESQSSGSSPDDPMTTAEDVPRTGRPGAVRRLRAEGDTSRAHSVMQPYLEQFDAC